MELQVPRFEILLRKFIELKDPINHFLGLEGFLSWELKRKGVLLIQGGGPVHNVITDRGLKYTASTSQVLPFHNQVCVLGTGQATPVTTDVKLQAYGGSGTKKTWNTSSGAYNQGSGADRWYKHLFEYGLAEAVGNWTEVGFCWDSGNVFTSTGPDLWARVLFKDDQGNPITIQKTGEDTLTITYTVHVRRLSDVPQSNVVTVPGVGNVTVESLLTNDFLSRASGWSETSLNYAYAYRTKLGTNNVDALDPTRTACRAEIATAPTLFQTVAYVTDAMYREFLYEFPTSIVATIAEACYQTTYSSSAPTQTTALCRFTPGIPKDNTKKFRMRPRITYGRV